MEQKSEDPWGCSSASVFTFHSLHMFPELPLHAKALWQEPW